MIDSEHFIAVRIGDHVERCPACRANAEGEQRYKASALAVSLNGKFLAIAQDRVITVFTFDGKELKKVRQPWRLPGPVHAIAFDPSGTLLATANNNGSVYLLRVSDR